MFIDEDGDIADEFFEVQSDGAVRQITDNIKPQGFVQLSPAAISVDVGVILCEARH